MFLALRLYVTARMEVLKCVMGPNMETRTKQLAAIWVSMVSRRSLSTTPNICHHVVGMPIITKVPLLLSSNGAGRSLQHSCLL